MKSQPITIVLPVYGRSELLEPALRSVLVQTSPNWQLLIADDGSDTNTQSFIQSWMKHYADPRMRWVRRPQNLGLFANLNEAIEEVRTEWVLLLCSDDLLLATAVEETKKLRQQWPDTGLILSTFESINADGSSRRSDSAWHHDFICRKTGVVTPEVFLPALLRLGSLNGNLTGMAFSRSLWRQAGPFRSDWRHAADWEWLLRAGEHQSLVLNRTPIAKVRTHKRQLSNSNRRSGHELDEVAIVVKQLRQHRLLANYPQRKRWAAEVMQHQLWNIFKLMLDQGPGPLMSDLRKIHAASGLWSTILAVMRFAPERLRRWVLNASSNGRTVAD